MKFSTFFLRIADVLGLYEGKKEVKKVDSSKILSSKPGEKVVSRDHLLHKDYHPLGRLPAWYRRDNHLLVKNNRRINRFIMFQELRIKDAIMKNQFKKAVLIGLMLLKNSKSYQIILFNKVKKDGFRSGNAENVQYLLIRAMNKLRAFNLTVLLNRIYLVKNKMDASRNGQPYCGELREGEKIRPIGSPDIPSKMLSKSINDLIYALGGNKFSKYQHGFRRFKGTHTALYGIISYLRKHKEGMVYEFDFKSYFNTIKPSWVYRVLLGRSQIVAEIVLKIIHKAEYRFKEILPESELIRDGMVEHDGKIVPRIIRKGLPQGLNLSPLLATMTLELFKPPKGLFLYADDGLYIGPTIEPIRKGLEQIELTGTRVQDSKTGIVNNSVGFLNCRIDREEETITMMDGTKFGGGEKGLENKLRSHAPFIYNQEHIEDGDGHIKEGSYLARYGAVEGLGLMTYTLILLYSIIRNKPYKGYKYIWGFGVIDIIASTSEQIGILCDYSKGFNLKKIRQLRLVYPNKFGNGEINKGRKGPYIEAIGENRLLGYTKKEMPEGKNIGTQVFP